MRQTEGALTNQLVTPVPLPQSFPSTSDDAVDGGEQKRADECGDCKDQRQHLRVFHHRRLGTFAFEIMHLRQVRHELRL
jgi:hypothetical protein